MCVYMYILGSGLRSDIYICTCAYTYIVQHSTIETPDRNKQPTTNMLCTSLFKMFLFLCHTYYAKIHTAPTRQCPFFTGSIMEIFTSQLCSYVLLLKSATG